MGFAWQKKYYVCTVLPFGLSTACYVFTKVLRPLVKHVRAQGIRLVLYLDDGIVVVKDSQPIASGISNKVQQVLTAAGLIINIEKSSFEPSLQATWLGFDIDLALGIISIPQNKISNLKTLH